ncbi:SulP family inorganic anion transporter [Rhodopirellula sp. MGV]|uniref:SulP family inorganic anion transporter n=1 Tax=Rhodopirellula sp. MGV TaxID=2023130 RepID=UPI000B96D20B|nr:SulP family inorganic anion transporter [Rhodopirellula sp. MGV]OYP30425.1 sulfate transporter [Rhodopirellula sp. MGV]PNY34770.1 sulfate transporter [Rhodopirellula baltica]
MTTEDKTHSPAKEIPRGSAAGFIKYMKHDLLSGLLVFLIALPLCLAIAVSSGYPPIAGIFTAIVGSILTTFLSNSELTIKGPAAGLIVIAIGCITEFGGVGSHEAYRAALAVGVAAAVLQICFGIFRAGILGEFFPISAVHGMLAAIGVIIIIKQIPFALGVINPETGRAPSAEPFEMVREIPHYVMQANPAIAAIGLCSVLIMFVWPLISRRVRALKIVPAPMIVLLFAIPMGMGFDLIHQHSYVLRNHEYQLSDQYLVNMPDRVFGLFDEVTYPDFSVLRQSRAWWWVMMFFIIGSLESLLSAKAVDLLDPWKRKTNLDRDIIAVGVGNLAASLVGGLPMISEIVRSRANIDNGARTRFADMWHGVFLLLCVALIPTVLHRIPLAALAAMLIYTGYRLAHPVEFLNVYRVGKEQLAIFVTTLVMVLATDLLVGVAAGIILKIIIHVVNGVPIKSLFKPYIEVQDVDNTTCLILARESAVFSNWIPFRRQIEQIGLVQHRNVIVDVSETKLVDHSVMEKLEEMERDFEQEGLHFEVRGLDSLQPLADNAHAARKRGLASMRRLTIVASAEIEDWLEARLVQLGATGYTVMQCRGAGRTELQHGNKENDPKVRIEVVMTWKTSEEAIDFLRSEVIPNHRITACVETVDVVRRQDFESLSDASHLEHALSD